MGRVYLSDSLVGTPTGDLQAALMTIIQQLEDQINAGVSIASLDDVNRTLPQGMVQGDLIFDIRGGSLRIGIFNGGGIVYAGFFVTSSDKAKLDSYKGQTSSALPPALLQFPANGDYGFHTDTTGPTYYLAHNFSGTIKSVVLT